MDDEKFKEIIQSCHLNFLIGSGLSAPYLKTLGIVEKYLAEVDKKDINTELKKIAQISILKTYFDHSIQKNCNLLKKFKDASFSVFDNYKSWICSINEMIIHRKSNILNKQVNLFTTNIDIFLEKALEELNIDYNDGFSGRLFACLDLSGFKKSIYKTSSHYENKSELPSFNLYKMHGSITWQMSDIGQIFFDKSLSTTKKISKINFAPSQIVNLYEDSSGNIKSLESVIEECKCIKLTKSHREFINLYDDLIIINPNKDKFKTTILNYTYYELLRIYSNELEKENSVLFVMGFSFADEHIREITLRAINSNPTLIVCVFAYDSKSEMEIRNNLNILKPKYDNLIYIIRPTNPKTRKKLKFNLNCINKHYFRKLVQDLNSRQIR